jgi:CheY-like chemotaxis protein
VFINLIVNAVQALGGRPPEHNVLRIATSTDADGNAVVEVSDNGSGMTPEVRTRIFEPFFTTKPVGQGAGLGLSVVHGIVTAAGGRVECHSMLGVGTTLRVVLPPYRSESVVPEAAPVSRPVPRRARVLVVDDEVLITEVARSLLAAHHDVAVAGGGEEALQMLARDPGYDLVLCDVMMPGTSGRDVYERLRAESSPLLNRLVFMTGGATSEEMQAFLDTVTWVSKPFNARTLRDLVAQHAGKDSAEQRAREQHGTAVARSHSP